MPVLVEQKTWVGGVHDFVPLNFIPDNAANRLENVETHMHGTVRRRGGTRVQYQHAASSTDAPILLKSVNTIRGANPLTVACYNTAVDASAITIDYGSGGGQVPVTSGLVFDDTSDAFALLDRIYFTKAGKNPQYWEPGKTSTAEELATPGLTMTSIPPVTTGTFFQGRGWAGGDPTSGDLVYFSSALGTNGNAEAGRSPFTWDHEFQAFRMVTGKVTAIVPFRNAALMIFTDKGIETLEPNCCDILNTHRLTMNNTVGCVNRHTIQVCGEEIFFMDQEGHIRSLSQTELDENRGVTNQPLSLTINRVIERQTKKRLTWARSGFSKGIYWIWMPTDGSQYANEGWGWSIRDQAWVGPYFLNRDQEGSVLVPSYVGGITSQRFQGDQERTYFLIKRQSTTAIKTVIAFEPTDLKDEETTIPVVVETKAYEPKGETRKEWKHLEQDFRILLAPGDATVSMLLECRSDEGTWVTLATKTLATDAGPHLPVALPFALSPDSRQEAKTSFTSIAESSYLLQIRMTIRDSVDTWEILAQMLSAHPLNIDFDQ